MLFAFDPNFRGYTDGTIRMFGNALLHPVADQSAKGGFRVGLRPARPRTRAAQAGAEWPLPARFLPLRPELLQRPAAAPVALVRVPLAAEDDLRVAARLAGVPAGARVTRDLNGVSLRVPNPRALDAEELSWPRPLFERLARAGVRPSLIAL